jgi:hypothetical protein
MVIYCIGTDIQTLLLKEKEKPRYKWRSYEEEGGSSYWIVFKEVRGYGKLKDEALDRIVRGTGFRGGCGLGLRPTMKWMNVGTVQEVTGGNRVCMSWVICELRQV